MIDKKISVIKDNKDAVIAALNNYLDKIYNLTDAFFDGDNLKKGLTSDVKLEKFILELKDDAKKYENVRQKIVNNDFNLSVIETNYVALSFVYMAERWGSEIKKLETAKTEIQSLINILMEKNIDIINNANA